MCVCVCVCVCVWWENLNKMKDNWSRCCCSVLRFSKNVDGVRTCCRRCLSLITSTWVDRGNKTLLVAMNDVRRRRRRGIGWRRGGGGGGITSRTRSIDSSRLSFPSPRVLTRNPVFHFWYLITEIRFYCRIRHFLTATSIEFRAGFTSHPDSDVSDPTMKRWPILISSFRPHRDESIKFESLEETKCNISINCDPSSALKRNWKRELIALYFDSFPEISDPDLKILKIFLSIYFWITSFFSPRPARMISL